MQTSSPPNVKLPQAGGHRTMDRDCIVALFFTPLARIACPGATLEVCLRKQVV